MPFPALLEEKSPQMVEFGPKNTREFLQSEEVTLEYHFLEVKIAVVVLPRVAVGRSVVWHETDRRIIVVVFAWLCAIQAAVPHIGWNGLCLLKDHAFTREFDQAEDAVYFVHSFRATLT